MEQKNTLPVIGEDQVLEDDILPQANKDALENIKPSQLQNIGEEDEGSDDDEFLKRLDDEEDPFNAFDPSMEPDMERRLSEKPAMKKEDSYEYKMTDLDFEFPADESAISE